MQRVARFQIVLLHVSRIPHESSPDKKKFHPSLKGPRKGASPHVPQNEVPMEKRCPGVIPYVNTLGTRCG